MSKFKVVVHAEVELEAADKEDAISEFWDGFEDKGGSKGPAYGIAEWIGDHMKITKVAKKAKKK